MFVMQLDRFQHNTRYIVVYNYSLAIVKYIYTVF